MIDDGEVQELIGQLSNVEVELLSEGGARPPLNSGKKMIEHLAPGSRLGRSVNTIPGGNPGACHPLLLVALGLQEDAEPRILAAIEHVMVSCAGRTHHVIFWAAWWDSTAWHRHRTSFGTARVDLKLVGSDSLRLS
jgi:hypothetical protein